MTIPSKSRCAKVLAKIRIGRKLNKALKIIKPKVELETIIRPTNDLTKNHTDNEQLILQSNFIEDELNQMLALYCVRTL